jgi:hypothetical protein
VQRLLLETEKKLINRSKANLCRWFDAKTLTIRRYSKGKKAGFGHDEKGSQNGYKIHEVEDKSKGFVAWAIKPMNHHEITVADELISRLNWQGCLVGDGVYDKNRLYDPAGQKSVQLIAPQRIKNAKSIGHRRHSKYRLRALLLQRHSIGQSLLDSRDSIERMFGQLTNLGCGLSPLPNWVRTRFRVEMWVRAKMIFYHLWKQKSNPCAA